MWPLEPGNVATISVELGNTVFVSLPFRFTQYQQKPVSISEVLGLTLNFVRSHDSNTVREEEAKEGEEEAKEQEEEGEEGGRAEKRPRTSTYPIPQFVLQEEQQMLEACVARWQDEVEQDMQGQSL